MTKLNEVLAGVDYQLLQGNLEQTVTGIEYDSRRIKDGNIFVCITGFKMDGHDFAAQAVASGATVLVVERPLEGLADITMVQVEECRAVLPMLAANFYGHPSKKLSIIGVTGTNGKTTTTHLIKSVLEENGARVGLIGTLNANFEGYIEELGHTTPESLFLERFMRRVVDAGGTHVVMEVSSHALDLGRVDQIDFDGVVFTNLTQDHLDYHQSMEEYLRAKRLLFDRLSKASKNYGVINTDDEHCLSFLSAGQSRKVTYAVDNEALIKAKNFEITARGSSFAIEFPSGEMTINTHLAGKFNIYNILAAIGVGIAEKLDPEVIKRGIEKVTGVPGRFESVDEGQEFSVIVDYAHTPDGLENILKTARQIVKGRIITIFGAGGDRDKTKRPLMGRIVAHYSDFSIVTSDNPRSEEPLDIIQNIVAGLKEDEKAHYAIVPDRREAIRHGIYLANPDDMVIIAGKGHEDYQLIKGKVYPFDDRLVAREYIREKESHD